VGGGRFDGPLLGDAPSAAERERRIAVVLFVVTGACVFLVHWLGWQPQLSAATALGSLVFSCALLFVMLCHELGHYVYARWAGFRLSLPWFLPAPFLFGTLGAVIKVRERPRTRDELMGLGAAGPLAGLGAIVLLLMLRAMWPEVGAPDASWELRRPLLWWAVGAPLGRVHPPTPTDPLGFAAWVGCLVTAMNLLPFGQLDGGHVLGALRPSLRTAFMWAVTGVGLVLAFWWPPWAVWVALLHGMGAQRPLEAREEREPLSSRGRWLGGAVGVCFLLCATPAPTNW
jgi:Zn-dependent protease